MKSKKLKNFVYLLAGLCLFSCENLNVKKKLTKDYVLVSGSDFEGVTLSYKLGTEGYLDIVFENVVEVGVDDDFIIAKRMINANGDTKTGAVEYYIIPLDDTNRGKDLNKMGPLSRRSFMEWRQKLGISGDLKLQDWHDL